MPLQATSGAASYDAFGGGVPFVPTYIEDVFSTWLYTGNGLLQTVTNGIDLAGKGGLVWVKPRNLADSHELVDTVRGADKVLQTNNTDATWNNIYSVSGFSSTGFTYNNGYGSGVPYASWTFREQAKFFDCVTYTGNGASQNIAHNLGSVPGCMIVKRTDSTGDWWVYHRSLTNAQYLRLNLTNAVGSSSTIWDSTTPTSTEFTLGASTANASGGTYVAYLFAHNAGGFGLTGTDNVISCGSYTTNSSAEANITLGWEPQWVLVKPVNTSGDWRMFDNMRGAKASPGGAEFLYPNTSDVEATGSFSINATGFRDEGAIVASNTIIYIAIRRGPMKTPTTGTSVFGMDTLGGTLPNPPGYNSSFPVDMAFHGPRSGAGNNWQFLDRLRNARLISSATDAESSTAEMRFDYQNGFLNSSAVASDWQGWMFRRAPGFMDVCCYTGTGVARTVTHNLGVAPELMICKVRSTTGNWVVYVDGFGGDNAALNTTGIFGAISNQLLGGDATTFTVSSALSASGATYVAYLFATCPGVSKVGSYTGTGTTQTINCGFTAGSRFVLIKRTDSTGGWYVWDSARGIVAGNDPYLLLNSTAAEVTNTDFIDTAATGFEISSTAPAAINASGGTFIYLAIA